MVVAGQKLYRLGERFGIGPHHYKFLAFVYVALFLLHSNLEPTGINELILDSTMTVLTILTILAIGKTRLDFLQAATIACPFLLLSWLDSWLLFFDLKTLGHLLLIIALFFFFSHLVSELFKQHEVSANHLAGCIVGYFQIGFFFSSIFYVLQSISPHSIIMTSGEPVTFREISYFSFTNLSTVGYGDMLAQNSVARTLAVTEGISGQLYLTLFVGQVVGMFIGKRLERQR